MQILPDPYPSSSTPNLQTGLHLHAGFTRQYLKYAERDALAAAQQAGATAKYAYAVARRKLFEATGAGKVPSLPQVLRPRPFEPNPIKRLADSREDAHDYNVKHGLAVAAGVAADVAGVAADVALGLAYGRYRQHRKMVQQQAGSRM
ncbi:uncharacterized protein JCM10292_003210 [Rhodotorula paludigena]|uniref:uncharacterized protein n=1 Tax=Rhodotorula paludigena TaxID=86838 RepID=UPI003173CFB2